jgi:DNA/RNA endonuclease YhcR with UshA esterase domain
MKPLTIHFWCAVFVCAAAFALTTVGEQPPSVTAAEAAKHIGENAIVTDKVDGVHRSGKGNLFLDMGGKYPNQAFTAYIPESSASKFPDAEKYEGRTVAVSGKITLYHGKPEIIVTSSSQVISK